MKTEEKDDAYVKAEANATELSPVLEQNEEDQAEPKEELSMGTTMKFLLKFAIFPTIGAFF